MGKALRRRSFPPGADDLERASEYLSVSILAERAMDADALSTILFLMGSDAGLAFIEKIPDTEAVFITKTRNVRVSSGLRGKVFVRDERFTLAED